MGVGLSDAVSLRGGTARCLSPMSDNSSEGVSEDGGAEVGDDEVDASGDETGEDEGQEGEAGISISIGYDSDSMRLRSSE